ncbi:MAG: FtsQ-type POTRA domain-containing protein [Oscillospiraceae bacterium]|nr:FtsQ-type POTRA domain-containing protein [Oscillospiraceae bacterium]
MQKPNSQSAARSDQLSGNERIINRARMRKRKNRRKKIIIYSVLAAVFLAVGITVALTMFFNISEITVTGDAVYSSDVVINASGTGLGDNLIFLSKTKTNELITEKLPYVGSVKVKRHLPTRLELIITKTDAVYAMVENGYYTLLDKDGKVLENELEYIGENIIILNIGEVTAAEPGHTVELANGQTLEKLKSIREVSNSCGLTGITFIDLSDIYNIKLIYQGRITLELGETDNNNLIKKLDLGRAAIDTQNEENELYRGTINLTVEGKGYWSEETVTTEQTEPTEETTDEEPNEAPEEGTTQPTDD